jgi:hypothetical protein
MTQTIQRNNFYTLAYETRPWNVLIGMSWNSDKIGHSCNDKRVENVKDHSLANFM